MLRPLHLTFACLLWMPPALAQTTQGLISGRVIDSQTGAGIAGARVSFLHEATGASGTVGAGVAGYYVLPLLSPGLYQLRAVADSFQPQEVHELELPVAGRIDLDFRLRPLSDVWEAGQFRSVFLPGSKSIVTFYGPDVDTSRSAFLEAPRGSRGGLESTVSEVMDPAQVRHLPLAGRDVYTMLVTQPGVTADTATARGLGLSINGQRPSASNFLLDGVENNNYLVTGPLTAIAPEAVSEYRVSTNNFSAEYGRTAGFVANAVTRSGTNAWHGIGYFHLKNEALNANGFQQNLQGLPRSPLKEAQSGFHAGGPIRPNRVFVSSALERFRSRGRGDPVEYTLPTALFLEFLSPDSTASKLLRRFPAPAAEGGNRLIVARALQPPASVDRWLGIERVDYVSAGGRHRLLGRVAIARLSRPDFIWTPYRDFVSGLDQNTHGVVISGQSSLSPALTSEARAGWSAEDLQWDRPHPEIPTLASAGDGTVLPGSPAFYAYRNRSRSWEFLENVVWTGGRHVAKAGAGLLLRRLDGHLTAGRDGLYIFGDSNNPGLLDFALDQPRFLSVALAREALPAFRSPDFSRAYRYNQYFLFAQDTFRMTPRLTLNYGIRYENFGAPKNTGTVKDPALELGSGANLSQRLAGARWKFPGAGDQTLYEPDHNNLALRFGFSYALRGNAGAVLRGAYGIFYDRPFDNLWQNLRNNNVVLATFPIRSFQTDYLEPISTALARYRGSPITADFPPATMYQPGVRDAYVHSYFFGAQRQMSESWGLEVNTLGSLGRKLITTDVFNRLRENPALGWILYRGNQGLSSYHALTAVARHRGRRGQFQLAYTWSHTIDNQSEPLAGDFFNLDFTRIGESQDRGLAAFSRQFDSRIDRGSSDFDQRQNLVFFSIWDLPAVAASSKTGFLFRNWRFSQLAAFRTGFPYTVRAPSRFAFGGEIVLNNRADVVDPLRTESGGAAPVRGGERLLNRTGFREPAPGTLGNSGRNAFRGPGLFNVDLSLSRTFALPWLGESGRLTFRADAFNFLNHANLNNPETLLTSEDFGVALFGRKGRDAGFPALTPFSETARQVQVMLRIEF